ncbi:hypothetical protein [Streptomyces anulatus]
MLVAKSRHKKAENVRPPLLQALGREAIAGITSLLAPGDTRR